MGINPQHDAGKIGNLLLVHYWAAQSLKNGIFAQFEMRAEAIQKWTQEIQVEMLVSLHSYVKRSQELPSTPPGTVKC